VPAVNIFELNSPPPLTEEEHLVWPVGSVAITGDRKMEEDPRIVSTACGSSSAKRCFLSWFVFGHFRRLRVEFVDGSALLKAHRFLVGDDPWRQMYSRV